MRIPRRRGLVAASLALTLAGVAGVNLIAMAPAGAATPAAVWTGTQVDTSYVASGGPAFDDTGQAQGVQVGTGNTEEVAFTCEVVTVGVVESTGVGCWMVGLTYGDTHRATTTYLPGNAAVAAGVFTGPAESYLLCIQHNALGFQGGTFPQYQAYCINPL
ncbi:MAG: hypothetical protein ACYDB7_07760 [Mycobacteriales bacterium]